MSINCDLIRGLSIPVVKVSVWTRHIIDIVDARFQDFSTTDGINLASLTVLLILVHMHESLTQST